jgi:hypothetical protein
MCGLTIVDLYVASSARIIAVPLKCPISHHPAALGKLRMRALMRGCHSTGKGSGHCIGEKLLQERTDIAIAAVNGPPFGLLRVEEEESKIG